MPYSTQILKIYYCVIPFEFVGFKGDNTFFMLTVTLYAYRISH